MPVSSWSPNAGSNTGILSGLTLDGSVMTVPQLDNAFREMAAQIAAQLGKVNFKGADMSSASTTNLANATGWYLDITGTTTITAFGTVDAGQMFILRFTGILTLTYNASSLILPGAGNITTAAGDVAMMVSLGSGNWRCIVYQQATGVTVTTTELIGVVVDFAGTTAPARWLLCYGQAISRTTYAALFAAISTTHGAGDGSTTFNLPDYRGRVGAGQDDMGGTSANRLTGASGGVNGDTLGASGGDETHVLTEAQLATHDHTASAAAAVNHIHAFTGAGSTGGSADPGVGINNIWTGAGTQNTAADGAHGHTITVNNAGSGAAHNNVQPTIILNKIIYAGV